MRAGYLAVACLLVGSNAVHLTSVGKQGISEQVQLLSQVQMLGGQTATSEGKSHAFFTEDENLLNTLDATDGPAEVEEKQDSKLLMQTSSEATKKRAKASKRDRVGLLAQTHTDSQEQQEMNEMSESTLDSESQMSSAAQAGQKVESRFFYIDDFFYWLGCKFVTCDKQQPSAQLSKQLKAHAPEPIKITQPVQVVKAPVRKPLKTQQQEHKVVTTVTVAPKVAVASQIKKVKETIAKETPKPVVAAPKEVKVKTAPVPPVISPVKPKVAKAEQPKQATQLTLEAKKQTKSEPTKATAPAPNTISMPVKQNTLNIGHKDQVSAIIGPLAAIKPSTSVPSFAPKDTNTANAQSVQRKKEQKPEAEKAPVIEQQQPQSQQNPFADFSGFEKKVESMHPLPVPHVAIPQAAPVAAQAVAKPITAPSPVRHQALPKQQIFESRPAPQMRGYAPQPKADYGTFQQQAMPYYGMQQQPQQRTIQMQSRMYPYGQPQQPQMEQQDDEDAGNGDDDQDQQQQVEPSQMPMQQQGVMSPMMYQQQAPQMKMMNQFQPPIGLAQLLRYQQPY